MDDVKVENNPSVEKVAHVLRRSFTKITKVRLLKAINNFLSNGIFTQRMELLGDKVIGLTVTKILMNRYLDWDEGDVTKRISFLTSRHVLSNLSEELLRPLLFQWSRKRYCDLFETLIGMAYSSNKIWTERFIDTSLMPYLELYSEENFNPKGELQEILSKQISFPTYVRHSVRKNGKECYYVQVSFRISGMIHVFYGTGYTVKKAETRAAKWALVFLNTSRTLESGSRSLDNDTMKLPVDRSETYLIAPSYFVDTVRTDGFVILKCDRIRIFPVLMKLRELDDGEKSWNRFTCLDNV